MIYRVCKSFEVESGHMLSKHPGRCQYPHGHSRLIEIVLSAETLDANDMVVDFKALKLAVADYLDSYDHAMAINTDDPRLPELRKASQRIVEFESEDPTTEAMARRIYDHLAGQLATGASLQDDLGNSYQLRSDVTLERVRVGETSSSWAEYSI